MKQKIISIGIIAVLLGLGGYKYYDYKHPSATVTTTTQTSSGTTETKSSEATTTRTNNEQIVVDRPINGTIKGVVEVGASGFNSFVVNIDKEKNWELVTKEFGESLAYEGFASTDDVKKGLKSYLAKMFEKGVAGRNAHFVISSGALKNPKTELIAKAIEQMGYVVNRVSAEQEGKFALKALLPKAYRGNSFVVDIGSGNTKVSYYDGLAVKSIEGPGAKYYQNSITDIDAYNQIKTVIAKVPTALRVNFFIIAGVPFKMAKESTSGEERFTYLEAPDDYSAGDDVKMKSGINIYKAIYDVSSDTKYIFDWDANFTIGFLLNLN